MKKIVFVIALIATTSAFAVDYPKDVIGKWISLENNQDDACQNPQLVVEKNMRYDEFDVVCVATKLTVQKISNDITRYVATEKCEREDSNWTQTSIFEPGGLMLVTEKRGQDEVLLRLKYCQ